jgi:acyl carrier protein
MNNREEIRSKFIALLAPFVDVRGDAPIMESASLTDDLNVNSARFVDIILESEERFNISIDDDSADRMRTVGDAIDVIAEKSAAAVA